MHCVPNATKIPVVITIYNYLIFSFIPTQNKPTTTTTTTTTTNLKQWLETLRSARSKHGKSDPELGFKVRLD
jgi:hypothetical protein